MPVQHQKMRRKALRLLLRHTDEAMDELRDDNDEMLRGGSSPKMHKTCQVRPQFSIEKFGRRCSANVKAYEMHVGSITTTLEAC